jgi:hypothetical protein
VQTPSAAYVASDDTWQQEGTSGCTTRPVTRAGRRFARRASRHFAGHIAFFKVDGLQRPPAGQQTVH